MSIDANFSESENRQRALFKYLPPTRVSVIRELEIRFTQASSLNDTLELKPPIKGVADPERLKQIAKERLEPALWSQTNPEDKKILDERFPGLTDALAARLLKEHTEKAMEAIQQRHLANPLAVFDVTDRNFGILCLAESAGDIKMWAHYADGGRGYLIEFDPDHPWFHARLEDRDSFRHLRKVVYVESRPASYLLDTTEKEFLYTKWAVWQDEREWRIIRNFNDAKRKVDGHVDPYGNEILLFSVPPDSIRSVVTGHSSTPKLEAELSVAIRANETLRHVALKRAIQSNETGQITVTD